MRYYKKGFACSQSILMSFADEFDLSKKQAAALAAGFGSGMGRMHRTCGAVTGAFMVMGLKYGNSGSEDLDKKQMAYRKVRELNKNFEAVHGTSICKDLLINAAANGVAKQTMCDQCVKTAAELCYESVYLP